jgi:hypothetical protein
LIKNFYNDALNQIQTIYAERGFKHRLKKFLNLIFNWLDNPMREGQRQILMKRSQERFNEQAILKQWNEKVFKHG